MRPVDAEVVGARVGQRACELITAPDGVAVGRAGDRQRSGLEVHPEPAAVSDREVERLGAGVEVDVDAVSEAARWPHPWFLDRH